MKKTELITKSIRGYLNMENIHSAIMLTGEWGCGKSFYVKDTLQKELGKEIQMLYVSLYGLETPEDINNAVRKKYLSIIGNTILSFKKETDEKSESKKLLKKAFGGLSAFIPGGEIISKVAGSISGSIIELLQATEITHEIDGKQVLLVFDDFERSTIDIQVLMGLINEYAENNKVKVLVVANEDEIKDEDYVKSKEKFIFRTTDCNIELREQLENVIKELKFKEISNVEGYKKDLKNYISEISGVSSFGIGNINLSNNNIRIYIFAFELYAKIYDIIENSEFEYLKEEERKIELFKMFYWTCFIFKNGKEIENAESFKLGGPVRINLLAYTKKLPKDIIIYIKFGIDTSIKNGLNHLEDIIKNYELDENIKLLDNIEDLNFSEEQWQKCVESINEKIKSKNYKTDQIISYLCRFHTIETVYKLKPRIDEKLIKDFFNSNRDLILSDLRFNQQKFDGLTAIEKLEGESEYKNILIYINKEVQKELIKIQPENYKNPYEETLKYIQDSINEKEFKDIILTYKNFDKENKIAFRNCFLYDNLKEYIGYNNNYSVYTDFLKIFEKALEDLEKDLGSDTEIQEGTLLYAQFAELKRCIKEYLEKNTPKMETTV